MTGRAPMMAALETHMMKIIAGAALTFAGYVTGGTTATGTIEGRVAALESGASSATADRYTRTEARVELEAVKDRVARLERYVERQER